MLSEILKTHKRKDKVRSLSGLLGDKQNDLQLNLRERNLLFELIEAGSGHWDRKGIDSGTNRAVE